MEIGDLQDLVVRNAAELAAIRNQISGYVTREEKAATALGKLRRRAEDALARFDRDSYKATDQRLLIQSLASEIRVFSSLGYDLGLPGGQFLLGVDALLQGRNEAALESLKQFMTGVEQSDRNLRHAHYLAGMICYNRRDYAQAIEFFRLAFTGSPEGARDWQSLTYVAELSFLARKPMPEIERAFVDIETRLSTQYEMPQRHTAWASLYLKKGNCYAQAFLDPRQSNTMVNPSLAIACFKEAKRRCPAHLSPDSLLPVIIDYSLAQAMLLAGSVDMDIAETPQQLLARVFNSLRRVVLTKREEIILAQSYFMLGTCAVFCPDISRDLGEIYMEYARHQTLTVPSDVCFYSCVSKELLTRDEFVEQIDFYNAKLETKS